MVRDRHNNVDNPTDEEFIKQQAKAIKKAKEAGNEVEAQRLANQLIAFLGWDQDGI